MLLDLHEQKSEMPRKAVLLKSLVKGRVRASMNKYNLFNLYKKPQPQFTNKNLYGQKWLGKQETRAYHGEHLTELRWQATFDPNNLASVAQLDSIEKIERGEAIPETPVELQTYAVLEKRLDFAIFRSMFASSIRQARQFILHGNVKVNDITIKSPGYELKPGDIFSCDPEKVLLALGKLKPGLSDSLKITEGQIVRWNTYIKNALTDDKKGNAYVEKYVNKMSESKRAEITKKLNNKDEKLVLKKRESKERIIMDALQIPFERNTEAIDNILSDEELLNSFKPDIFSFKYGSFDSINGKLLEIFKIAVTDKLLTSETLKSLKENNVESTKKFFDEILSAKFNNNQSMKKIKSLATEIHRELNDQKLSSHESVNSKNSAIPESIKQDILSKLSKKRHESLTPNIKQLAESGEEEFKESDVKVHLPFQDHLYGRNDPVKNYFTPWEPRQFLAPFAILPHHIEVSFLTCHAVYLRDPVARPGQSEVISPFNEDVHERAYMYYARKGK